MSTPVRWGILGTARIAEKVGPAIQQATGSTLAAVASREAARAGEWAAAHDVATAHDSYQALIDDPDLDAIYIPLPPHLHREWTIRAAEAGKHVLCEKPLALSAAEGEEMAAACEANGVQLLDGVMWYHHPRADQMKAVLETEPYRNPKRLTSAFTFCWDPVPTDEFRLHAKYGGGSLYDLGWYCVGLTLWAFGKLPSRVMATARWRGDIDMNLSGWMFYGDDSLSAFDCGFDTVMRKWFEYASPSHSLVCDDFTRPWKLDKTRFWTHDTFGNAEVHDTPPIVQEVCMIEAMNRIVQEGQPDPKWPRLSIDTQRVCDALLKSAREGQPVEM